VGKGYAEGPAAEERYEALERGELGLAPAEAPERSAVYGATEDNPERHFLGWLDDVDPDQLFESGKAWGLAVMRRPSEPG
jgi:hypothetical protein